MKYGPLGRTGVQVSELCFGTMSFGGDADEAASAAMYAACRDAGINFFDTADTYNNGESERILGRLMKGHRDDLVVATKCYNPQGDDINARGSSRRHVTRAVEACLKRLGTDRVDVLFLHQFDRRTPIDEQMRGLEDVVRAGKVLYPAASNYAAWQTLSALAVQERRGWTRIEVIEPMYNLVKRQAEVEILPMAEAHRIAVIPYSPAAGGLLSGKYTGGGGGDRSRLHTNQMYQVRYGEGWMHDTARRVRGVLRRARDASGERGRCLGRRTPRGYRPDHRRPEPRSAPRLARLGVDRHDPLAPRGDRRPLPHPAPRDGPHRGTARLTRSRRDAYNQRRSRTSLALRRPAGSEQRDSGAIESPRGSAHAPRPSSTPGRGRRRG